MKHFYNQMNCCTKGLIGNGREIKTYEGIKFASQDGWVPIIYIKMSI